MKDITLDKRDHFHFNADSGLFSIKKIEGNRRNHVEWATFEERTRSMRNGGKSSKPSVLDFRTGKKL